MKHTISADEYQELGKTYYKQKEYEKAIEAFTNGIEASVLPAVSLWDYRAASQLKLGDLNAAVKDGREAIRADKKDVRGYLRTGHALQKLDKLQTAVGIYKYGMKNVPITDNNFVLLQKLHNQLTRQLSPPKATDPFTVLPVELAELVVCFLPFKNVVNCLRVSRGWKAYLVKRPNLWLDLDLSEATKPVSRNFIRRAVQYSENGVTRLTVHRFQHTDVLLNISTVCKGLEEVEILSLPMMLADSLIEMAQCAVKLKKLIIHPEVTAATVTQILRHRPSLVHAEFLSVSGAISNADWRGPFPNLQTLVLNKTLTTHAREQVMHIDSLMERSPLLQNLTLSSWTGSVSEFSNLESLK
jgi:F-box/TPR repeat protein Pof3